MAAGTIDYPGGAVLEALSDGRTWLDQRHPDYRACVAKWTMAKDHYCGDVFDADKYLVRKATAESEAAYLERVALADYTPHFSTAVDALAGMLFAVEGDADRHTDDEDAPGLGSEDDPESPFHRLWRNCDGQGTGWITFFKQLAIELIVTHRAWLIVDQNAQEEAVVRMWPSTAVVNWWYDETGRLAQVLVTEKADKRAGVQDSTKKIAQQWVLYTLTGWERWEKDAKGNPTRVGGANYATPYISENGEARLPIFPVELPLRRNVGWLMSKKATAIFNKESERDHILRTANFPILLYVGSDTQYKAAMTDIKRGVRALRVDPKAPRDHSFVAPSSEPAQVATEVLKRKVEEFYITFFREYGDAAAQKTATEVKQDVSAGVGAFLQLLKAAVDDAENEAFGLISQIELPGKKEQWFNNYVERADTFVPIDVQAVIDAIKLRYFKTDQPLPLGPTGLLNIVKQVAQYDGVEIDEQEVKSSILMGEMQRLTDLWDKLPVPAEIRVEATLNLLVSLGYIDPKAAAKMDDGTDQLIIDKMRQDMMDLALADDEARKRMAQPLDMGPPQGNGGAPPARTKVKTIERTGTGFRMTEEG